MTFYEPVRLLGELINWRMVLMIDNLSTIILVTREAAVKSLCNMEHCQLVLVGPQPKYSGIHFQDH
jgi:hypothetical protein